MRVGCLIVVALLGGVAAPAQHCTGREFDGAYALHLAGTTRLSGKPQPAAVLARLVFSEGRNVSGYSSVNFTGYLLGNPTTGNFEVAEDCTLILNLQDDSGGFQHFRGKILGGERAEVHQIDPGTGEGGVLERTSDSCNETSLSNAYTFTVSGAHTPVDSPGTIIPVSEKGLLARDLKAQISVTWHPGTTDARKVPAKVHVQSDCIVEMDLTWPSGESMHLRGILTGDGAEILAIDTDPNETVSARFGAR